MDKTWEVIVGNVGSVFIGSNGFKAKQSYAACTKLSEDRHGRFANESVTLMCDGEVYWEYIPQNKLGEQ